MKGAARCPWKELMTAAEQRCEQARAIIASACRVLRDTRETAPIFTRDMVEPTSADCYVLLRDASKMFCAAVSEHYGEPSGHRWSPVLPELLVAHPEKCGETLALAERKDFQELSHFLHELSHFDYSPA